MEGLEISEVMLSKLEFSGRLDSEYYQKSFLKYEELILSKKGVILDEFSDFLIGPFGSAFTVDNYTEKTTYRYIRGKDVKPLRLMDDDNVYMPESHFKRLKKYSLKENDILVSVVGTLGNAALVTKNDLPAIFSCKSTVLRTKNVIPAYLLVYINSKYGNNLLMRKERGAIQKGLNLDDLKQFLIFNPSIEFQKQIESLFLKSLECVDKSKLLYHQAEQLLLKEIGLENFKPSEEGINIKSFQDSFLSSGRLDAEYYQPKYEQTIEKVKKKPYDLLKNIVSIKKSVEVGSSNYGESNIPFLRVADFSKQGITESQRFLSESYVEKNKALVESLKPKRGTILFSKDGSVGTAYHLRKDLNGITSGAILHLNLKIKNNIVPEYLTLVLNSEIVQMQAERDAGGSIILHWRTDEIKNVVVPIINYKIQIQIASLVEESFSLKSKSEKLLSLAKEAVEMAIEQSEERALLFIEEETKFLAV